jgi:hypothetical protein
VVYGARLVAPRPALIRWTTSGRRGSQLPLHRLRLLDRFRWHQSVGSQAWHYSLGPAGAALIAATRGAEPPSPAELRNRQLRMATNPRLAHLLGVNGIFTSLAGHARRHPDCALGTWWSEHRCAAHYGQLVRPDGYGTWTQHGQRIDFFVEFDTGTEPLTRVATKLNGYNDLATAGGPNPPILFWFPTVRRETNARKALAAHARSSNPIATTNSETRQALDADPADAVSASPAGCGLQPPGGSGSRGLQRPKLVCPPTGTP